MWIVYHSSSKVWASSRWLTGAFRLFWSWCSRSRFSIFVEPAKCAALLIAISLACNMVLGQGLLHVCGHWVDFTQLFPTVIRLLLAQGYFSKPMQHYGKDFLGCSGWIQRCSAGVVTRGWRLFDNPKHRNDNNMSAVLKSYCSEHKTTVLQH